MDSEHPALVAARNSWRCAMTQDKQGWLALMADDIQVEDPIGVLPPTNPDGNGVRGKEELAAFFDRNIANTDIHIEPEQSFAAGNESAHVLRLTTSFPNGVVMKVRGIFTYRLNDDGLLTHLRGYWSMANAEIHNPNEA